jgi:hypothetical protein
MKKKSGLRPTLSAQTRANWKAFPFFIRRALTGGPEKTKVEKVNLYET